MDLCYAPHLAEEVTLQPIRRYGFDAAILFADILLIPQALGQKLWFEAGEGPRLAAIKNADTLSLQGAQDFLSPISDTVRTVALITTTGFAYRICRRAMDGSQLYGGRARHT